MLLNRLYSQCQIVIHQVALMLPSRFDWFCYEKKNAAVTYCDFKKLPMVIPIISLYINEIGGWGGGVMVSTAPFQQEGPESESNLVPF